MSDTLPRTVRAAGLGAFCAALLVLATVLDAKRAALYGLFVITWIGLTGLNVMFGHGRQFNLAQNMLYGIGAFAYGVVAASGANPWLGIAAGTVLGAGLGALTTLVAGRVRGLGLAILTLGIALATPDLFSATPLTGGFDGLVGVPPLTLGSQTLLGTPLMVVLTVIALAVFLLSRSWLTSSWGSALRAVAADPEAAAGMGLRPIRYRTLALVIGGGLIGFAGGLYGSYQGYVGYLSFPVTMVILWYLGLILGGAGTLWGPLIGAAVITVVPESLPVSDDLQPVLWGVLLVAMVVLAPRGAAAGLRRLADALPPPVRRVVVPADVPPPTGGRTPRGTEEAPSPGGTALEVDGLSMRIGGLLILDDVTLRLRAGAVTALLGANGAGKSTLVNCLSGYLTPSAGTVRVRGADVTGRRPAAIYGHGLVRTFQHPRLVAHATVFENVLAGVHASDRPNPLLAALPRVLTRATRARQHAAVWTVLRELGADHLADSVVKDLSAGNRQIVSIARGLMAGPRVLLLDEPVAGLSHDEMRRVADVIGVVSGRGVAVLVIEHRLDFVRWVAADAYCLDSGVLLVHGPLDDVLADPKVRRSFLGSADAPKQGSVR